MAVGLSSARLATQNTDNLGDKNPRTFSLEELREPWREMWRVPVLFVFAFWLLFMALDRVPSGAVELAALGKRLPAAALHETP